MWIKGLGLLALVLAAFVAVNWSATAESADPAITVTASGTAEGHPDLAQVNAAVVTTNPSAEAAVADNAKIMTSVLKVLKQAGIGKGAVGTTRYNVSPRRYRPKGAREGPEITDFQVSNQLQVKVEDVTTVGQVLDLLTGAGVTRIDGLRFLISDPDDLTDTAMARALARAREKAEVAAKAVGAELGAVMRVEEQGATVPQPRMMALAERAGTPVVPGDQTVRVSISVTYGLVSK